MLIRALVRWYINRLARSDPADWQGFTAGDRTQYRHSQIRAIVHTAWYVGSRVTVWFGLWSVVHRETGQVIQHAEERAETRALVSLEKAKTRLLVEEVDRERPPRISPQPTRY